MRSSVVVAIVVVATLAVNASVPSEEKIAEWRQACESWATYEDTEDKSRIWQLVNAGAGGNIKRWQEDQPCISFARSNDGRGPLFWAYEFGQKSMAKFFIDNGASGEDKDTYGNKPIDLAPGNWDDLPDDGLMDFIEDVEAEDVKEMFKDVEFEEDQESEIEDYEENDEHYEL